MPSIGNHKIDVPLGTMQGVYRDGVHFSNPLYFKTLIVPILLSWPFSALVLIIFVGNIWNILKSSKPFTFKFNNKLNFFPILQFATILDNAYDWHTKGNVEKYTKVNLTFLIIITSCFAFFSILYTIAYTYDSVMSAAGQKKTKKKFSVFYNKLQNVDSDVEENQDSQTVEWDIRNFSAQQRGNRSDLPSNIRYPNRWKIIRDEYLTINVVYGLTVYNILLVILYIIRYLTFSDHNYLREIDVVFISLTVLGFLFLVIILDWFLFDYPPLSSVIAHYYVIMVYTLNFTIDFFNQVEYCEIITLATFFIALFIFIYKIKIFLDIGRKFPEKED